MPARSCGGVEFLILGPLVAVGTSGEVLSLGPPRHRALLAALLVNRGVALSVDRLISLLWSDDPPVTAATMVHGAVAGLRRVLDPSGRGKAASLLVTRSGGYVLQLRRDQVDAERFERLFAAGRRLVDSAPARALTMLADALALWRGPALAGIEEPFARDAAARWDELGLECIEERMAAELALGHHHDIVAELAGLVVRYPLRERLCAQLMLGLYRCGRQADALAAYRTLSQTLRVELGLEPGPELRRLQRAILQQSDSLDYAGPIQVAGVEPGRGLPVPFSTFVGRVRERDEVTALIRTHRLVTLTGAGGSGKTRLALEVARAQVRRVAARAWLVELAALRTPSLIGEALAETLGVRAEPGRAITETLAAALSGHDAIIVLDNCEHLLDACAALAQTVLASTERVRLVTTSREPLSIPGEVVYLVRPLATVSEHEHWERIAACEAVRLFAERANEARAGFTITQANAPLVGQVCRRLDGLPLALELAAARMGSMPLHQLAERLEDRFGLLDSATRTTTPRHRSLSATVTWSYELLNEPERALFTRLAVFPAAFTLDAAEQVTPGSALDARDIATLLRGLVARSVVQLEEDGEGHTRYRLLETTREYGRARLDTGTPAQLRERHARWYLTVAQEAEPHLSRAGSAPWLARLHREHDNFRAALEWSFEPDGDPGLGASLVRCLFFPWDLRGARGEGLHWVHAGLTAIGEHRPAERLPLLSAGALFHAGQADFDACTTLAVEQLALARTTGARAWEGDALAMVATMAWARGEFEQARPLYEDAVAASLAGGDLWRASLEEAQLARLHRDNDDPTAAMTVALRALTHAREVGEALACGLALDVLASLEHRRGDIRSARHLVHEALDHYELIGYIEGEASALHLAGRLALASHEPHTARETFTRSLHRSQRIGHREGTALTLEGLAAVATATDDDEGAVLLLGSASALRRELGIPPPPTVASQHQHQRERLTDKLGHLAAEQTLHRSATLPIDELIQRTHDPTTPHLADD